MVADVIHVTGREAVTLLAMVSEPAELPNDIETLKALLLDARAGIAERDTELAAAKAGLVTKSLEIEKLRVQIARLKRVAFGHGSERLGSRDRTTRASIGRAGDRGSGNIQSRTTDSRRRSHQLTETSTSIERQ